MLRLTSKIYIKSSLLSELQHPVKKDIICLIDQAEIEQHLVSWSAPRGRGIESWPAQVLVIASSLQHCNLCFVRNLMFNQN